MRGKVFQPKAEDCHPWFIISTEKQGQVLAVNVSDAVKHPDSTCFIKKGEHEVITKDSAVVYRQAMVFEVSKLSKDLAKYANIYPDCHEELLQRIIAGALHEESGLTLKFLKFLE